MWYKAWTLEANPCFHWIFACQTFTQSLGCLMCEVGLALMLLAWDVMGKEGNGAGAEQSESQTQGMVERDHLLSPKSVLHP